MNLPFLKQLFPINCLACLQPSEEYLCPSCLDKIKKTLIPNHFFISSMGEMIFGYSHYAGVAGKIIRSLKYGKKIPGATVIARLLLPIITLLIQPELIVPVPISWQKMWSRGFNQCHLIGEEIHKISRIPVKGNILQRKFSLFDKDQVTLSASARKKNLNQSFYVNQTTQLPEKLSVLLLDDVATTGKTIYACRKAMKEVFPHWDIKSLVFAA